VLVEEGDPAAHGQGVVARLQVGPGDVLVQAGGEADRPVGGVALVGADGVGVAVQQLDPDVLAGEVPARAHGRLEDDGGAAAVGQHHPVQGGPHVPGAGDRVDPVVGVAGVAKGGLVLLQPAVQGLPPEGDQPGQVRWGLGRRRRVAEGPVGHHPVAQAQVEVAGLPLQLRRRAAPVGHQQPRADVGLREVVARQPALLQQQRHPDAVDHHLAAQQPPDPPRRRLQVQQPVAGQPPVEPPRGGVAERPQPGHQRHGATIAPLR
jgi:hypothetical protein